MRASVMTGPGTLTLVEDAEVDSPKDGEVLVRVRWCSACHSDLHALDSPVPPPLPTILGHEAAGVVEAVGTGVTDLQPGDQVVLSMVGPCGKCAHCLNGSPVSCPNSPARGGIAADGGTRISHQGRMVYRTLRVGGFSEYTVIPREAAVKLPADLPLDLASVLGCSVQTGYGAIVNIARVRPGGRVGVLGLGAVGIAAVQAARIAGATHIVGIDPLEERRALAAGLGATTTFTPREASVDALRELAGDLMLEAVVDTVTDPDTTRHAVRLVGPRGIVVVVGVTPPDQDLGVAAADIVLSQKRIAGCYLGNCVPTRDIPVIVDLWRSGLLDLDSMVTRRRPLEEVAKAFDDLRSGIGLRTAIEVSPEPGITTS